MLSRHHVELSLLSTFLLFGWLFRENLIMLIAISLGVFIGCLIPDTDLQKSKLDYMGGIAGFFSIISKSLINPLVGIIFETLLKKPIDEKYRGHRGVTHTFYGILTYCLLIEGFSLPILLWLGLLGSVWVYSLFVFGLFFGGILHLIEDSCTKSGITPFYPLNSERKYSGKISTSDFHDQRPKYYSIFLLITTGFILAIQIYLQYPILIDVLLSVISFLTVWIIIIIISKI